VHLADESARTCPAEHGGRRAGRHIARTRAVASGTHDTTMSYQLVT